MAAIKRLQQVPIDSEDAKPSWSVETTSQSVIQKPSRGFVELGHCSCCKQCAESGFKTFFIHALQSLSHTKTLGPFEHLLSIPSSWLPRRYLDQNYCTFCDLLSLYLPKIYDKELYQPRTVIGYQDEHGLRLNVHPPLKVKIPDLHPPANEFPPPSIRRLHDGNAPGKQLRHGRLPTGQVDIGLFKKWIHTCDETHNCAGHSMFEITSKAPFRVIDVNQLMIMDAPSNCRYAALSYVWGDLDLSKLSTQAINHEHALDWNSWNGWSEQLFWANSKTRPQLPRSIANAIYLCRMLNIQYLWVDCLCIVQTDSQDKHIQVSHMHAVYSNSYITLVSASGSDANAGLAGVGPPLRPNTQLTFNSDGHPFIFTYRDPIKLMESSKWYTRGWTFQEFRLSPRSLIFTESLVFFYCRQAIWTEDVVLEDASNVLTKRLILDVLKYMHSQNDEVKHSLATQNYHTHTEKPHTSHSRNKPSKRVVLAAFKKVYTRLVQEFTTRKLSRDEDALDAFTGILQALQPTMGSFFWGLPENMLSSSLLWQVSSLVCKADQGIGSRRTGFPSWSWAGWKPDDEQFITTLPLSFRVHDRWRKIRPAVEFYRLDEDCNPIRLFQLKHVMDDSQETRVTKQNCLSRYPRLAISLPLKPMLLVFWAEVAQFRVEMHQRWQKPRVNNIPPTYFNNSYSRNTFLHALKDLRHRPRILFSVEDKEARSRRYKIYNRRGRILSIIELPCDWRIRQPEYLDFILIAKADDSCYLIMVDRTDRITYRVQVPRDSIPEYDWKEAAPTRTLVLFG